MDSRAKRFELFPFTWGANTPADVEGPEASEVEATLTSPRQKEELLKLLNNEGECGGDGEEGLERCVSGELTGTFDLTFLAEDKSTKN